MIDRSKPLALKPFHVWVRLFALYADKDPDELLKALKNAQHYFNTRMQVVRDRNGYNARDLVAMIYFAFLYDPFHKGPKAYGNLSNLVGAVVPFTWFCKEHANELMKDGADILQLVMDYAPSSTIGDEELTSEQILASTVPSHVKFLI